MHIYTKQVVYVKREDVNNWLKINGELQRAYVNEKGSIAFEFLLDKTVRETNGKC